MDDYKNIIAKQVPVTCFTETTKYQKGKFVNLSEVAISKQKILIYY